MPSTDEIRSFEPVTMKAGEKVNLAMQKLFLIGRILPIGARLMVQHTFECDATKPLELIYTFPLPRDAALRKFRVSGKGFSVRSQLKPVDEAVKIYEQGIEGGHLSTLARQHADGLVSLTLGNIRPGVEVTVNLEILAGVEIHDDGIRFRFPFTLSPSYHCKAKAVAIDPGVAEMELPEEEFGDLILPQFRAEAGCLALLLEIAFGEIRHFQVERRVFDEEINFLHQPDSRQHVRAVFENVLDDDRGPMVIPRAHHVTAQAGQQLVLDTPAERFVVGDFLHVVVHDGFLQTVLVKTAPVELLDAVKLVHQLCFVGVALFALFSVNITSARFDCCRADTRVECGVGQLP